jgi:glucokinase
MKTNSDRQVLVADIGGTSAKFALAHLDTVSGEVILTNTKNLPCSQFQTFEEVLKDYQRSLSGELPRHACIAGPVLDAKVKITNLDWFIDAQSLKSHFKFDDLLLTNDFVIQAYATLHLSSDQIISLRDGSSVSDSPRLILGPGTGLGVATLTPIAGDGWQPQAGEGGHVSFAPETSQERVLLDMLMNTHQRVSVEDLISGPGLERVYSCLVALNKQKLDNLGAAQITELALVDDTSLAFESVQMFLRILGSAAGNAALTCGAFNGVYFSGGILPRIVPLIEKSQLVNVFTDKPPMNKLLANIPLYLINGPTPALVGAAHLLFDHL